MRPGLWLALARGGISCVRVTPLITQSWRLGWDIGSHKDWKKFTQGQGRQVRQVSGPPISGGQMGFAEAGKTLPAKSGAVGYAPIPQWRGRRGDRADLSDLVFGDSVFRSSASQSYLLMVGSPSRIPIRGSNLGREQLWVGTLRSVCGLVSATARLRN